VSDQPVRPALTTSTTNSRARRISAIHDEIWPAASRRARRDAMVLEMDGETSSAPTRIRPAAPGTEKLIEYKTYLQAIPYFDRLDYVRRCARSTPSRCGREADGIEPPRAPQYIRVLSPNHSHLNHLLKLRVGARSGRDHAVLWGVRGTRAVDGVLRARLGRRLHAQLLRPGGVHMDLPPRLSTTSWRSARPFRRPSTTSRTC